MKIYFYIHGKNKIYKFQGLQTFFSLKYLSIPSHISEAFEVIF